jgi:hypothetical protein
VHEGPRDRQSNFTTLGYDLGTPERWLIGSGAREAATVYAVADTEMGKRRLRRIS